MCPKEAIKRLRLNIDMLIMSKDSFSELVIISFNELLILSFTYVLIQISFIYVIECAILYLNHDKSDFNVTEAVIWNQRTY